MIGLAATLGLGAGTAAQACSPLPGYVRPSNFELVQIADAVVVATPLSAPPVDEDDNPFEAPMRLRVTESLKGDLAGEIEARGLRLGATRRSDPKDIFFSHPEGHMGPCNRMTLAKGGSYLLFLGRRGEHLGVLGFPFSRVNEDYAGPDSAWSRVVRTYLDIQREPDGMVELARLEALKAQLEAKPGRTRYDAMLAADIGAHLGSVSPWKPTGYLLAARDDLKAGRPPRYAPRNPVYDQEQSGVAMFADMIMGASGEAPGKPARDPRETAILEALIEPGHADALPVFEPFLREDASVGELDLGLRFLANNGGFGRAYDLIEARFPTRLEGAASAEEAQSLLRITAEVVEDPYGGEPPRWRADPSTATRWPRLSLALARLAKARFGVEAGFHQGPKALLTADYRADPELTLMLSGHEAAITDWARAQLVLPGAAQAPADAADDPLKLPIRITLRWAGLGAGAAEEVGLNRMFCAGPARRAMLIETWGREGGLFGADFAKRMAASPQLDEAERSRLTEAVRAWNARLTRSDQRSPFDRDDVMAKLARGERPTAQDLSSLPPLTCPSV
ncbi:hypothetical protein AS593_22640 [Caulobacter vibrioides]|nr:hypothetical protein AS593_22640 [Caulobacter vibrioides]